ncbi:MAG: hypothetical protein SPL17_06810, partial [Bacteroidales bacterium]|nr:hypothetical protein [Bacteroidales bacterium]
MKPDVGTASAQTPFCGGNCNINAYPMLYSFPLALILYGRKKYWLISEVAFDARDNGIHFFKYISNNHK